jgi:MFS family permease
VNVLDRASSNVMQRRVLAATSVSYVVVLLDTSIVNVALDRISVSLATDIGGLQWVMNAYTLAFASLLLTGGTLGARTDDHPRSSSGCQRLGINVETRPDPWSESARHKLPAVNSWE